MSTAGGDAVDLELFADPWEHLRLLSDTRRNQALIQLLRRRAPGARVVEVGCGSGLLSCIAARLGARQVVAVEPTGLARTARALVSANGLDGVVQVVEGEVQDLVPRQVDLAFSELLNAEPFREGVLDAMDAVRPWLAEGAVMAPSRLRVWVALVRAPESAAEAGRGRSQVRALGQEFGLRVDGLHRALGSPSPYKYVSTSEQLVSAPALVHDLQLGTGQLPEERVLVDLDVVEPQEVGGAVIWWEAELDEGLTLDNAPGRPGHWGQLVCAWDRVVRAEPGSFPLWVCLDEDDEVQARPG